MHWAFKTHVGNWVKHHVIRIMQITSAVNNVPQVVVNDITKVVSRWVNARRVKSTTTKQILLHAGRKKTQNMDPGLDSSHEWRDERWKEEEKHIGWKHWAGNDEFSNWTRLLLFLHQSITWRAWEIKQDEQMLYFLLTWSLRVAGRAVAYCWIRGKELKSEVWRKTSCLRFLALQSILIILHKI